MDYKFILILAICLILYYIYHELEKVKIQVEELTEKLEKKLIVNNLPKPKSQIAVKKSDYGVSNPSVNLQLNPNVNFQQKQHVSLPKPLVNVQPKPILKSENLSNNVKTVPVRSPNQGSVNIPFNSKVNKLSNTNDIILIEDDLTTVDSQRKEDLNVLSETETPESYENNSQDLALYSNDNNETSITVDDIIDKTDDNFEENKINTIIENVNEDESEEDDERSENEINIIENNNDSSDILLLDDSNEASTSSTELKKKNQKSLDKMNEIPIIADSLNQILSTKKEIICSETTDKNEDESEDEEIDVNVDIDEIVNESSNNKFKIKTLKRKKLADLQKIASEYGISLNKVKEGKLKNKTKNELCKEIVSKQY